MSSIFARSGSTMDPNTCTIIMGVLQIAGTYAATWLVDIFGRKILMLWSTGGMAMGLTAFGAYTYFAQNIDLSSYSIVPLLLMAFVVFVGNMGLIALTLVLLVELFPAKVSKIINIFKAFFIYKISLIKDDIRWSARAVYSA